MSATAKSRAAGNSVRSQVSPEEWEAREDLAALYRTVAERKWDDHIFTHMTARVPATPNHFLVNPLGLAFNEITASSLLKIDDTGEKVLESEYPVLRAAFIIHSAVYKAVPQAQCAIHLHTPFGTAVSAQEDGLLPITQHAMMLGRIAYHEYEGVAVNEDECERLGRDFDGCNVMILRNHGTLSWGISIPDAFNYAYNFERACEYQINAMAGGAKLHMPSREAIEASSPERLGRQSGKEGLFTRLSWNAVKRNLDRTDPSYRD
jgi:ribulose-5-phosphate 4-epimerase/fuculose-1-phosphate aldolase